MTADVQRQIAAAKGQKPPAIRPAPPQQGKTPPAPREAGTTRKKPRQLESSLQVACLKWFRLQYPEYASLLFAIPNGGRRGKAEAARLKQEGVMAGVPDLLLAVVTNSAPGLFIELKVGRNKSSEAQRQMQMSLSRQGYRICIVYTFDQFRADVQRHIGC